MSDKVLQDNGKATDPDPGNAEFSVNAVQLLRTVQVNTLLLSQMADQKASILMGATFLVFSIAVSRSLAGDMPWALAVLAVFAFLSALLAVLAVLPSVRKPEPRTSGRTWCSSAISPIAMKKNGCARC